MFNVPSGALDIMVVQHEDGVMSCTPFHVRFSKVCPEHACSSPQSTQRNHMPQEFSYLMHMLRVTCPKRILCMDLRCWDMFPFLSVLIMGWGETRCVYVCLLFYSFVAPKTWGRAAVSLRTRGRKRCVWACIWISILHLGREKMCASTSLFE